jgi:hypothetical protein
LFGCVAVRAGDGGDALTDRGLGHGFGGPVAVERDIGEAADARGVRSGFAGDIVDSHSVMPPIG